MIVQVYGSIQVIISVIFFFSVVNTMTATVLERMREFGTMMALGNDRKTIFLLIIFEALFLALIGSTLGLLIGSGAAQIVSAIGIKVEPPSATVDYYLAGITLSPGLLIETFAISLASALLSSVIPAYRASHFPIIRALQYV
jgi:putative ABC transport system permease protein